MMRRKIIALGLLVVFILSMSLFLAACMGEPAEEADLEYLLRQGRKSLRIGKGSVAYNYYRRALHIAPRNLEANYGFVLALDLRVFSFIDGIVDILAGVFIFEPSLDECEVACGRLEECDLLDEAWTSKEDCVYDCPFGLQPFMFETMSDGSSCFDIRDRGLEWIIPTTPEDCVLLCEDLELCNLIHPPVTFTVEECIAHCPYSYVERHSKNYLDNLGKCNGNDRTSFEHITVGLQLLFREIGLNIPPKTIAFSDNLLAQPNDYQFYLKTYRWTLIQPPLEIELDGRFDHGFLHWSKALSHGLQSLLLMATAVNLEMNFPAFDINLNYGAPETTEETFAALIRSIEILLYDPIFPLGFQIVDEPWAYAQLQDGAKELGWTFGSLAEAFEFALTDHDRQSGKAFGYNDENNNFNWDEGEYMEIKGVGIKITRRQAVELVKLCKAVEANMVDREPFDLALLTGLMESMNLGDFDFVIDLMVAWFPDGKIDMSKIFYEPDKNNMRNFLETLLDKLRVIEKLFIEKNKGVN